MNSNSNNIDIGENAQVRGAIGADNVVSNSSFGDSGESSAQLNILIERLVRQLEELNARIGGGIDDEIDLARAAEEELQSAEPKHGRIRTFVSSAMRGVKEIGEAAKPAVETYNAIQGLM